MKIGVYLYSEFYSDIESYENSKTNILFTNINVNYFLGKKRKLSGRLSLVARPIGSIYTVSEMSAQFIFSFGWKLKVLKDKGTLSLSVNDLFNQSAPSSVMRTNSFQVETQNFFDSQKLIFSFSYRFGNRQLTNRKNRDTGKSDENNRID